MPETPTTMCKPGWGYGDTNHCHSGPPGHVKDDEGDDNDDQGEQHSGKNEHAGDHGHGHGRGDDDGTEAGDD